MSTPSGKGDPINDPNQNISKTERLNPFHSSTGPATSTAGPHKHNLLNKLDPRIDSDLDGSKTVGTTSQSPASTAPSRYSNVSESTQSTTSASDRTSHSGSVDTHTTSSLAQPSRHRATDPLSQSIHNQGYDGDGFEVHEDSYHKISSTDYASQHSESPVDSQRHVVHQASRLPATSDHNEHEDMPSAVRGGPPVTVKPSVGAHADAVPNDQPKLGFQAEKESIWTAGAVPGPPTEKEVAGTSDPVPHQPTTGLHSGPTESHALATADHDHKGIAQQDHGEVEVKDLGWNAHPDDRPAPLVGGLPNEELWTLVRRFDKVGGSF